MRVWISSLSYIFSRIPPESNRFHARLIMSSEWGVDREKKKNRFSHVCRQTPSQDKFTTSRENRPSSRKLVYNQPVCCTKLTLINRWAAVINPLYYLVASQSTAWREFEMSQWDSLEWGQHNKERYVSGAVWPSTDLARSQWTGNLFLYTRGDKKWPLFTQRIHQKPDKCFKNSSLTELTSHHLCAAYTGRDVINYLIECRLS